MEEEDGFARIFSLSYQAASYELSFISTNPKKQ